MPLPTLSARRWFWLLMGISLAWCIAGYRWDRDPNDPRWMRKLQNNVIAAGPRVALVPAEFVFGSIQGTANLAISHATGQQVPGASLESLQERVHQLEARNDQLSGLLDEANQSLINIGRLPQIGLSARDVLEATILSSQAGIGSSMIHLDKGSADGVRPGMAVVAPLEHVTVLGRVIVTGQKDCDVQLLSDPQMKVRADIVRDSSTPITAEFCVVEGIGGNQMQCETVNKQQPNNLPAPMRGDYVRLTDPGWPAKTQYMVIGQVTDVGTKVNQPLRYDLKIAPVRPVMSLGRVMIVIGK